MGYAATVVSILPSMEVLSRKAPVWCLPNACRHKAGMLLQPTNSSNPLKLLTQTGSEAILVLELDKTKVVGEACLRERALSASIMRWRADLTPECQRHIERLGRLERRERRLWCVKDSAKQIGLLLGSRSLGTRGTS